MNASAASRLDGATRAARVLVLRGGRSAERQVSLAGGAAVAAACRRLGHCVTEADIQPSDLSALDVPTDVVFPVLHGKFGEDGQLQAILEKRRLCYVGSDAVASRLAMDKDAAKRAWRAAGLPTADWACVDLKDSELALPESLMPPYVLKPVAEGSSIGVQMCDSAAHLQAGLHELAVRYERAIVERRLCGPELTVGILGDAPLPVIQVKTAEGFYDYEAKYHRNDTAYLLEPEVDETTCRTVQQIAMEAFRALACRDFARADLIVDEHAGPQLLEINTIPGFTDHSLLPKAAARAGIGFDSLVAALLDMALDRTPNAVSTTQRRL
jgi:D-alanine-D-alanine ligase